MENSKTRPLLRVTKSKEGLIDFRFSIKTTTYPTIRIEFELIIRLRRDYVASVWVDLHF